MTGAFSAARVAALLDDDSRKNAEMWPQFHLGRTLEQHLTPFIWTPPPLDGAGFEVGYDSPSQFSREYRRMYGVPPSRDAAALREVAVLANSP